MKNRNSFIDIEKFIASLVIMAIHTYLLYHGDGILPFSANDAWVFVEFFIFITGYYTAKHFTYVETNNKAKHSFVYILKKFVPLLPYTMLAAVVQWAVFGVLQIKKGLWGLKDLVCVMLNIVPFEGLMVQTSKIGEEPFVASFWYLLTLLLVFPVFLIVANIGNRYLKLLISVTYSTIYYSVVGIGSFCRLPIALFRVLAGLMVGLIIFEIKEIFNINIATIKSLYTVTAVMLFAITILIAYRNVPLGRFMLLCLIINLMIVFSLNSQELKGRSISDYLGRLSMPLYIVHYTVGTIVDLLMENSSLMSKSIIYYTLSIIVAMITMKIFEKIKPFDKWLQSLNNLKY